MLVLRSALIVLCLPSLVVAASPATLEELLRQNLAARGGLAKVAALRSLKFTGEMSFPGGMKFSFSQVVARPDRIRTEASMQGFTAVMAYEKGSAWQIDPFQGRKDPERLSEDEAKGLRQDADLDGPLIGWKEEGSRIEYLGTEDVDGTQAHKLKVSLKDGTIKMVYLDPEHFLEIRILTQLTVRGSLQESEADLGEYAQAGGVWFPMSIESGSPGAPRRAFLKWTKVEVNVPAEDADFRFPGTARK